MGNPELVVRCQPGQEPAGDSGRASRVPADFRVCHDSGDIMGRYLMGIMALQWGYNGDQIMMVCLLHNI